MTNTILSVAQLTQVVSIGQSDQTTTLLKNISFTVQKGELVSIVGPSGSGKSTLLYCISGITRPTGGTVAIAGINPYQLKPNQLAAFRRQTIGFIFQQYNLIQSLPVFENVVLQQRLSHQQPQRAEIKQLLTKMNFVGQIDGPVATLSGGGNKKSRLLARF
ncbi:ABC transporter ATP-binding protein [Latilactobacillus curvatus]|uniref:ABC transporter ATP-binding protein n=1 Tax=Latilactobacillus curvatus TaxID=28038 RepID=UPI003F5CD661